MSKTIFKSQDSSRLLLAECAEFKASFNEIKTQFKPHLHEQKNRHGTPNFWHSAQNFRGAETTAGR